MLRLRCFDRVDGSRLAFGSAVTAAKEAVTQPAPVASVKMVGRFDTSFRIAADYDLIVRSFQHPVKTKFVDEIIAVVDKRQSHDCYAPVRTISDLGGKIANACGQSSNYELVVKQMKLGGNGPIMANALAAMGLGVTYVGNLGYPAIHPVFADFANTIYELPDFTGQGLSSEFTYAVLVILLLIVLASAIRLRGSWLSITELWKKQPSKSSRRNHSSNKSKMARSRPLGVVSRRSSSWISHSFVQRCSRKSSAASTSSSFERKCR